MDNGSPLPSYASDRPIVGKACKCFGFILAGDIIKIEFRLSQIKSLILTETHFERKTDLYQYDSVFPMPEEIGNLIDLELEFTLDVGYRLFDTLDDTIIRPKAIRQALITKPEAARDHHKRE